MDPKLQMVQEIAWSPMLYVFYVSKSLADHFVFFVMGLVVLALLSRCRRSKFSRFLGPWLGFNAALLIASAITGGFWDTHTYWRYYATPDYVSDFSPFVPIRESQITKPFGSRRGFLVEVTMAELQMIWGAYALGAWALAALVFCLGRCLSRIPWKPVLYAQPRS